MPRFRETTATGGQPAAPGGASGEPAARRRLGFAGLDFNNTVVWNGLTVFLLDRAAEVAQR